MASLGQPGKLAELLRKANIYRFNIEPIHLTYTFDSPEEFLDLEIRSGSSKEHYERLSQEKIKAWHQELLKTLVCYQNNDKVLLTNEALIVVIEKGQ